MVALCNTKKHRWPILLGIIAIFFFCFSHDLQGAATPYRKRIRPRFPKRTLFHFFPNSLALRPYSYRSLKSIGNLNDEHSSTFKNISLSPIRYWSFARLDYPQGEWNFKIKFGASLSFFRWKDPGKVQFLHLVYSMKSILHLPGPWGSLFASTGIGPMYVHGKIRSAEESHRKILTTRLQVGYYKFLSRRLFLQVKHSYFPLRGKVFQGDDFYIDHFNITGLYLGIYFR